MFWYSTFSELYEAKSKPGRSQVMLRLYLQEKDSWNVRALTMFSGASA